MNLYQAALAYTARYATSKENLRRVLWRKLRRAAYRDGQDDLDIAASETEISDIINRLEKIGAVDDEAYARAQLRTLQGRGTSARAIKAKMRAKGVPPELLGAVMKSADPEREERLAAQRYAKRRRLGPYRERSTSPEQCQKDIATLCRAGFGYALAAAVIDGTSDRWD